MRREKIVNALRRLEEPPGREGRLPRARALLRVRLAGPVLRARLAAAWGAARAHPQVVFAAAVVACVALMVIHWS